MENVTILLCKALTGNSILYKKNLSYNEERCLILISECLNLPSYLIQSNGLKCIPIWGLNVGPLIYMWFDFFSPTFFQRDWTSSWGLWHFFLSHMWLPQWGTPALWGYVCTGVTAASLMLYWRKFCSQIRRNTLLEESSDFS